MTYHVDIKSNTKIDYIVESASDYYPYGKALRSYGQERYQSTYHERDSESGFDYRGARFYDSDVARFNSLDPNASDYASWSDYSYVLCNPVNLVDPDGKDPVDPPKKVGLGRRIVGLAVDFSPLGFAKGLGDAITGKDIVTGEKLSGGDRVLSAIPGGKYFKAAGTLFTLAKTTDKVGDSVGTANSLNKATGTKKAVEKYDVGDYNDLRKRSAPKDDLDLHHVPQKHPAGQVIDGYDPKTGPTIALPKSDHKTIPTKKGTYTGTARDQLAKDAKDLRSVGVPNNKVQEVINYNKNKFPEAYKKKD